MAMAHDSGEVAGESTRPGRSALWGKRIVVAEDESSVLLQLQRLVLHAGAVLVMAARSGPEAVEIVLGIRPDLVLMDVKMPGEYDGLEAARRILGTRPTCILMLTGYMDLTLQEKAQDIGVCGYLVKPVNPESILPALEAAVRQYEQAHCG